MVAGLGFRFYQAAAMLEFVWFANTGSFHPTQDRTELEP